jgi:hypothetical protein
MRFNFDFNFLPTNFLNCICLDKQAIFYQKRGRRRYTKNVDRKTVRKAVKNATEKRKPLFEATIFGFQPAPPWGSKKTRPE